MKQITLQVFNAKYVEGVYDLSEFRLGWPVIVEIPRTSRAAYACGHGFKLALGRVTSFKNRRCIRFESGADKGVIYSK